MFPVSIIVATASGTSTALALPLREALAEQGFDARVTVLPAVPEVDPARIGALLLISSTFGAGDVPPDSQRFLHELQAGRYRLQGLAFAVAGCGDKSYRATFAGSAIHWQAALLQAGGSSIRPPVKIDTCPGSPAGHELRRWAGECIEKARLMRSPLSGAVS